MLLRLIVSLKYYVHRRLQDKKMYNVGCWLSQLSHETVVIVINDDILASGIFNFLRFSGVLHITIFWLIVHPQASETFLLFILAHLKNVEAL